MSETHEEQTRGGATGARGKRGRRAENAAEKRRTGDAAAPAPWLANEAFPPGRLRSIALRRPTLADAYLAVTGASLDEESP